MTAFAHFIIYHLSVVQLEYVIDVKSGWVFCNVDDLLELRLYGNISQLPLTSVQGVKNNGRMAVMGTQYWLTGHCVITQRSPHHGLFPSFIGLQFHVTNKAFPSHLSGCSRPHQ